MTCAYCGQRATMKIVSIPEHVCFDHALEFWTGLLVYATDRQSLVRREMGASLVEGLSEDQRIPA